MNNRPTSIRKRERQIKERFAEGAKIIQSMATGSAYIIQNAGAGKGEGVWVSANEVEKESIERLRKERRTLGPHEKLARLRRFKKEFRERQEKEEERRRKGEGRNGVEDEGEERKREEKEKEEKSKREEKMKEDEEVRGKKKEKNE